MLNAVKIINRKKIEWCKLQGEGKNKSYAYRAKKKENQSKPAKKY